MARRSDHGRGELREMTLEAARKIAETEGLRGLKARRIARDIGYTIGTLYNLFEDLDDIIVHLNGRTLDDLYQACAGAELNGDPESGARALAARYIRYTRDHPKLWSLLFEHRLPGGRSPPDWHREQVLRLLGLLEDALAPLFPPGREKERHHSARVLWSSLHGICSLEGAGKLPADQSVQQMAETLITCFIAGLRHRMPGTE